MSVETVITIVIGGVCLLAFMNKVNTENNDYVAKLQNENQRLSDLAQRNDERKLLDSLCQRILQDYNYKHDREGTIADLCMQEYFLGELWSKAHRLTMQERTEWFKDVVQGDMKLYKQGKHPIQPWVEKHIHERIAEVTLELNRRKL